VGVSACAAQVVCAAAQQAPRCLASIIMTSHDMGARASVCAAPAPPAASSAPAAPRGQADHVKRPENWRLVEAARVVYSAGFFITVSPESILLVAKHCAEHSKIYCMNLSAPFISEARTAGRSNPAAALPLGPGELRAAAEPFSGLYTCSGSGPLHMLRERTLLDGGTHLLLSRQGVGCMLRYFSSSARSGPGL